MFWENYLELCKKINKSPNKVASEIGCSSGSVTAWKNGRIPKWSTLCKIAEYFDVSVNLLISSVPIAVSTTNIDRELQAETASLTPEQKKEILDFIKFKKAQNTSAPSEPLASPSIAEEISADLNSALTKTHTE